MTAKTPPDPALSDAGQSDEPGQPVDASAEPATGDAIGHDSPVAEREQTAAEPNGSVSSPDEADGTSSPGTDRHTEPPAGRSPQAEREPLFRQRSQSDERSFRIGRQQINNIRRLDNKGQAAFGSVDQATAENFVQVFYAAGGAGTVEHDKLRLRPMNAGHLSGVARQFVEVEDFEAILRLCRKERFVVLQSRDALLIDQIALALVENGLRAYLDYDDIPAYIVSMREALTDFVVDFPEDLVGEGAWFVGLNVPLRLFREISAADIERIQEQLIRVNGYLLLTVESDSYLNASVLGRSLYLVNRRPDPVRVVTRTIQQSPKLHDNACSALIEQFHQSTGERGHILLDSLGTLKEIYRFAEELVYLWQTDSSPEAVDGFLAHYQVRSIENWFDTHTHWGERAFIITLAFLDGAEPNQINDGYLRLLAHFEEDEQRPQLKNVFAGTRQDVIETPRGIRRVHVMGFRDPGLYSMMLHHIWLYLISENYHYYECMVSWLRELAASPDPRIRQLIARSIGVLSSEFYHRIEQDLIDPLVDHGGDLFAEARESQALNLDVLFRHIYQHEYSVFLQDVVGNILAYGIESGDDQRMEEIQALIRDWSDTRKVDKSLFDISKLIYQQMMALAFYHYAGPHMPANAMHAIKQIAGQRQDIVRGIQPHLRHAFIGTLLGRLHLPGDPRPDIAIMFETLKFWLIKSKKAYQEALAIDIINSLAYFITLLPEQKEESDDSDGNRSPLYRIARTDWPLLMFLSLQSNDLLADVTLFLRVMFDSREHRADGYDIIELWLYFAVGYERKRARTIRPVVDTEEYERHLRRVIMGILSQLPNKARRKVMLTRLRKLARHAQPATVYVFEDLLDYLETYTNEDGSPRYP